MRSPQRGVQVKKRKYPRPGQQGDETEPANETKERLVKSGERMRMNFTGN